MSPHSLKTAVIALWLINAHALAWADPISIGGVRFEIPTPPGCVKVTDEMASLVKDIKQLVPEQQLFVAFISDQDAELLLDDELVELTTLFAVQVPHSLVNSLVSHSQFQQFKQAAKAEASTAQAELAHQQMLKRANQHLDKNEADSKVVSVKVAPGFRETDYSFSVSCHLECVAKDQFKEPYTFKIPITMTTVYLKSKMLFLCVRGDDGEFELTEQRSRQWVEAIVAANPPDLRTMVRDASPFNIKQNNWLKLLRTGMLGFVIVGLIWIVAKLPGWTRKTRFKLADPVPNDTPLPSAALTPQSAENVSPESEDTDTSGELAPHN